MLCDNCRALIQLADRTLSSGDASGLFRHEVPIQDFQESVERKCYLCTRLLVQLGDKKWQRVIHELPKSNIVVFDKSAQCDGSDLIHVRLGCKLTPIAERDESGSTTVLGKSHSFGYLQVSLLARESRSASFSSFRRPLTIP